MFNKKSLLGLGLVVGLSGCTTVAELTGNDTATLSLNDEQDYQLIVNDAKAQKALDTTSSTYKRVNSVFLKMKRKKLIL